MNSRRACFWSNFSASIMVWVGPSLVSWVESVVSRPWAFSDLDTLASRPKTLTQWALATSFLNVGSRGKKFRYLFGVQNAPNIILLVLKTKGRSRLIRVEGV
ncbi:Hypothetical predicted protein [Prunus dulcis]|uniref:Uncharacterized protein n=1 Tax=Prunus dulcis TaxID=3755 RepID=A0A5E4FVD8_PRUDU|nr:Hypothetical predicted protein [Prunus dulcis]